VKVRAVDGNVRTVSLLLVTTFVGTPRGSRKKPNEGRSLTCRLWKADANLNIPCRSHAALCRGLERSLSEGHSRGMAGERHGMGESRPHCANQMGKTQSRPLAERHGMCELAYMWRPHLSVRLSVAWNHQLNRSSNFHEIRCISYVKSGVKRTSLDTTRPSTIFYRLLLNSASLRWH
jgi:hypothetical protein